MKAATALIFGFTIFMFFCNIHTIADENNLAAKNASTNNLSKGDEVKVDQSNTADGPPTTQKSIEKANNVTEEEVVKDLTTEEATITDGLRIIQESIEKAKNLTEVEAVKIILATAADGIRIIQKSIEKANNLSKAWPTTYIVLNPIPNIETSGNDTDKIKPIKVNFTIPAENKDSTKSTSPDRSDKNYCSLLLPLICLFWSFAGNTKSLSFPIL